MLARSDVKRMLNSTDETSVLPPQLDGWSGVRRPSLIERASVAAGELLGTTYGQLIYSVLEACKRGHMQPYMSRILLERCLPDSRPTPVTLPAIDCAADLVEADRRLMAAANSGVISHREWRAGQECILVSWEIRKQARLEEP